MENREIEFTIKANTKPLQESMEQLVDDISTGKKSMQDLANELKNTNSIKLQGVADALVQGLKESKLAVKDVKNEINSLQKEASKFTQPPVELLNSLEKVNTDLEEATETSRNFRNALDVVKVADGVNNLDASMKNYISSLRKGITDMGSFNAMVDVANKKQLKDASRELRIGIKESEKELQELEKQLIVANQLDVGDDVLNGLINSIKECVARINQMKNALKTLSSTGVKQGNVLVGIFGRIQNASNKVSETAKQVANRFKRIMISTAVISVLGVIRNGLSQAGELSESATNKFTAMSNAIAGSLIPVIESVAGAVRKAFVWIAGLINYLSGGKLNIIQNGIDATNKKIAQIGDNAKKSGKKVKDGLLGGMDEITNIEQTSSSGSGSGEDMSAQIGALGELNSMMEEMNALDFSWAEPLLNIFTFIRDNWSVIATALIAITAGIVAYSVATSIATVASTGFLVPILLIVAGVMALVAIILVCIKHWKDIKKVVGDVVGAILDWFADLPNKIGEFIKMILNGIANACKWVGETLAKVAVAINDGIAKFVKGVLQFIVDLIKWIINALVSSVSAILNVIKSIWDGIKKVFSVVGNWFADIFTGAYNGIKNAFGKIVDFFKNVWEKIKAIFSKVGQVVGDAITGTVKKAVNTVLSVAVKIINGFISAINIAIGVINAIPGVNIKKLEKLSVPSFDVGTNYVPEDMLAVVHKGERITPAKYNNDDWVGQDIDMSETNDLLLDLIDVVRNKRLDIDGDDIGRASVNYIQNETRRRGESVI